MRFMLDETPPNGRRRAWTRRCRQPPARSRPPSAPPSSSRGIAEEAEDGEAEDEAHYLFGAELLAADDVHLRRVDGVGQLWCAVCVQFWGDCCIRSRDARAAARSRFCVNFCPPLPLGSGKPDRAGGAAPRAPRQKVDWLAVSYIADMCRLAGWARGLAAWPRRPRPCRAAANISRGFYG